MKIILTFLLGASFIVLVRFLCIPSCVKDEWAKQGLNNRYYISDFGNVLDTAGVERTVIYSGFFSPGKTLDKAESQQLLKIMLDSANYRPGEWGTPEYTKSFYYVDSKGVTLGKTLFDEIGQTTTWPSTEMQTKYGALSEQGLKQVVVLLQNH